MVQWFSITLSEKKRNIAQIYIHTYVRRLWHTSGWMWGNSVPALCSMLVANPNRISMTTRLLMHIIVGFSLQNKPHDVFAHVDTWYVYILCLLKLGLSLNLQKDSTGSLHGWNPAGSRNATMFRTMIFVWVPSPSWNISDRLKSRGETLEKQLSFNHHACSLRVWSVYSIY